MKALAAVVLIAAPLFGYVRLMTADRRPLMRTDFANIEYLINDRFLPGATNADGRAMLTADSDPVSALRASAASWNNISSSTVRFAQPAVSPLINNDRDNRSVFVLRDDPEIRSVVGSALAVTTSLFLANGTITDSDILFNPNIQVGGEQILFSTTGAQNTIDLQATATHELGHALGADNSGFLGATMFQTGSGPLGRTLSSDDIAFVRESYPAPGSESLFGELSGRVTLMSGAAARAVLIAAIDPNTGIAVGALTGPDGAYSMGRVPPGRYVVYVEPLDGPVFPGNVRVADGDADVNFFPTFFGSAQFPTEVTVLAGRPANANIQLEIGRSPIDINFLARGRAGGSGDFASGGALLLQSGESLDILIAGRGINQTITQSNLRLVGAGVTIRQGTVRIDPRLVFAGGGSALRFTVDVTGQSSRVLLSIVVTRGTEMAVHSGALVVEPARDPITLSGERVLNAASLTPGSVAPDSWVSVFTQNLAQGLVIASTSPLPTTLGGTSVFIIDSAGVSRPAQLQFVSPAQLNFLVPPASLPGAGQIRIDSALGQGTAAFQIERVAPGIFSANSDGRGPAAATFLRVAANGQRTADFTFRTDQPAGSRANIPLDLGSEGDQLFLIFYGTGIRALSQSVTATIGGVNLPVLAAVAQGEFAGLDQINAGPVPRTVAGRGELDVVFTVDGRRANTVRVNIR